jgi:hypothetical protein
VDVPVPVPVPSSKPMGGGQWAVGGCGGPLKFEFGRAVQFSRVSSFQFSRGRQLYNTGDGTDKTNRTTRVQGVQREQEVLYTGERYALLLLLLLLSKC